MRLKVLFLALVLAISFVGVFTPEAKAQDASVTPWATAIWEAGYDIRSKEQMANGKEESDTDLFILARPQVSFGVRGNVNNVFVQVSAMMTPVYPTQKLTANAFQLFILQIMFDLGPVKTQIGVFPTMYAGLDFNNPLHWNLFANYGVFEGFPVAAQFSYMGGYLLLAKPTIPANNISLTADSTTYGADAVPVDLGYNYPENKVDVMLPKVVVGYNYGNPGTPFNVGVSGHFQTYKIDDGTDAGTDGKSLNAYGAGVDFGMNFAPIRISAHGHYLINGGNMGYFGAGSAEVNSDGDGFEDTTNYGGWGDVTVAFGAASLSAGVAYKVNDNSNWDKTDPAMDMFVAVRYNYAPNFSITPSVTYTDNMKDNAGEKEGTTTSFGVLFNASI